MYITTLGVLDMLDASIPGAHAFGQDVEVVPVQVHGMGNWKGVADNDADRGVCTEVVDVPLGVVRVRSVARVGKQENWMIIIGAEGRAVHPPERVVGGVPAEGDIDRFGCSWFGGRWKGEERNGGLQGIISASGIIVDCLSRLWRLAGISFLVVDGGKGEWLFGAARAVGDAGSHEHSGVGGIVCLDCDVRTLANLRR